MKPITEIALHIKTACSPVKPWMFLSTNICRHFAAKHLLSSYHPFWAPSHMVGRVLLILWISSVPESCWLESGEPLSASWDTSLRGGGAVVRVSVVMGDTDFDHHKLKAKAKSALNAHLRGTVARMQKFELDLCAWVCTFYCMLASRLPQMNDWTFQPDALNLPFPHRTLLNSWQHAQQIFILTLIIFF